MVELRKKQEEATIAGKVEKYIKEKFVNMITINIDKDGKVSTEGNADTKVKTNTKVKDFCIKEKKFIAHGTHEDFYCSKSMIAPGSSHLNQALRMSGFRFG